MSSSLASSPAYINESIGWKVVTTDLVTVSIAFVLVIGRLYTKYFVTKCPGWEDCCSVVALLLAIGRVVGDCLGVYRYDLGRHTEAVPLPNLDPLLQIIAADGLLYTVSITFAKLAILIFLYRIFKIVPKFRYTSWAVGAIMSIWALIAVLMVCFSCTPVSATFNPTAHMLPTTVCKINAANVENIFGFCNILVDFMLLLMPMPLLWTLHMTTAKKVGVSIIFANGAVICAIAILRQYNLYKSSFEDPAWDIVNIKIWMIIEVNLAIICGCLPVLQPLLRTIPSLASFIPSLFRSGHSAMELSSWPRILTGPRHRAGNAQIDDLEQQAGGNEATRKAKAPWREPDELSESGESAASVYHHHYHYQPESQSRSSGRQEEEEEEGDEQVVVLSALEPARTRGDRVGGAVERRDTAFKLSFSWHYPLNITTALAPTLISSVPELEAFLSSIPLSSTIYLDLEGNSLSRHRTISLITLLIHPQQVVRLIDISVLGKTAFTTAANNGKTLKSILEDPDISKCAWDVRNDADALWALYQVGLAGVTDIQLLENASRAGGRTYIRGLDKCVQFDLKLGFMEINRWIRTKKDIKRLMPANVFNKTAQYCVNDVIHLPELHAIYLRRIEGNWLAKVMEESARRVAEAHSPGYEPQSDAKTLGPWGSGAKQRVVTLDEMREDVYGDGDGVGYFDDVEYDDGGTNAADGVMDPEVFDSCWDKS